MLEKSDGSAVLVLIHDAGIERDIAFDIGKPAYSYGPVIRIVLDDVDAFFYAIEYAASVLQNLVSAIVGSNPGFPGRYDDGAFDAFCLAKCFERSESGHGTEGGEGEESSSGIHGSIGSRGGLG